MRTNTKIIEKIANSLGFATDLVVEWEGGFQRGMFKYNGTNEREECITVEMSFCHHYGKNSLAEIWYKKGYTPELMPEYWGVQTYVTDKNNNCYMAYNPTVKMDDYQNRIVTDFGWHLEATPENFGKLLNEVLKRFNSAK